MKLAKISTFSPRNLDPQKYLKDIDGDLKKIFEGFKGRIRFGAATDGYRGENISGEFQIFTSDAVADTEFAVAHGIGAVPVGRIIIYQDKAGHLYQGPATGTAWTSTNVYFKCDVASVTFAVFLLR